MALDPGTPGGPLVPPTLRDGIYQPDQYLVRGRAATAGLLAHRFASLAELPGQSTVQLAGAKTPHWTGDAGSAYATWLTELGTQLGAAGPALTSAAKVCGTAEGELAEAWNAAGRACSALNEVSERYRKTKPDSTLSDRAAEMQPHLSALWNAMVADDNAVTRLRSALDGPADTLAGLTLPEPPEAGAIGDGKSGEATVLWAIMEPVGKAMAAEGDTAVARAALGAVTRSLNSGDAAGAKSMLLGDGVKLSPAERAWVLNHLDDDHLTTFLGGLDPQKDRAVYNTLATTLPLNTVLRLAATDPKGYWHPKTETGLAWQVPDGTDPLSYVPTDQRGAFTTAMSSVWMQDKDFIANHVKPNANGTYTVTLYKDGQPFEVVVTPDVPAKYPDAIAHARFSPDAIYQKAYAQAQGELTGGRFGTGYDALNFSGPGSDPLATITGHPTETKSPKHIDFDDIAGATEDHRPVLVTTQAQFTGEVPRTRWSHTVYGSTEYGDWVSLPPNTVLQVDEVRDVVVREAVYDHGDKVEDEVREKRIFLRRDNGDLAFALTEDEYKRLIASTSISGK